MRNFDALSIFALLLLRIVSLAVFSTVGSQVPTHYLFLPNWQRLAEDRPLGASGTCRFRSTIQRLEGVLRDARIARPATWHLGDGGTEEDPIGSLFVRCEGEHLCSTRDPLWIRGSRASACADTPTRTRTRPFHTLPFIRELCAPLRQRRDEVNSKRRAASLLEAIFACHMPVGSAG